MGGDRSRLRSASVVDDDDGIRLGLPDSEVFVRFSGKARPYDDEVTVFDVRLTGPGLDALCAVDSYSGDHGHRGEFAEVGEGILAAEGIRLVDWLRELSAVKQPWTGERQWRSVADELRLDATCDRLGHVSLAVSIQPRPWDPSWLAQVTLRYALGDLVRVADALDSWFTR